MKTIIYASMFLFSATLFGQEEGDPDTTRVNMGKIEIILVDHSNEDLKNEDGLDTLDAIPDEEEKERFEAHWAGVDMGFSMLLNKDMNTNFDNYPYWKNDPARSMTWNVNFLEHKFSIAKQYFGVTTGLGFSFTQVAFKDNYLLQTTGDSLFATIDTVNIYSKNKLRAAYLTVPVLLEFCTHADEDKSFYLAAGVVGGVRIASRVKRIGEYDGKEFQEKLKGTYGLNSFKLDGTVRLGYGSWGAFASYSLLPLFDTAKTTEVYPLTFGLSLNF
ncbi:MAG: hypothetical protein E6Q38_04135 [Crocinitomicaceae bacterium]|nr:MAG: hypothetical protein E6Q38_04135 [Crocinitomicaceae bacterium]